MRAVKARFTSYRTFGVVAAVCMAALAGVAQADNPSRALPDLIQQQLNEGKSQVVIPPGQYYVAPLNGEHLRLRGLEDVEIVAEDVELIGTETTRAITIEDCRNLTIRGLTIDYQPLSFTQGRITAMHDDPYVHEVELFDGYPAANLVQENKYEIFNPETRQLRTSTYYGITVEPAGERRLRVKLPRPRNEWATERMGDLVVLDVRHAPSGYAPHVVYMQNSENLRFVDVTTYAGPTFGFLEVACDGTVYERCRIDRRPMEEEIADIAEPRLRSTTADAFHSKAARRGPSYIECIARFQGDDAFAINGDYHFVTESDGETVRVLAKRELRIDPGDALELAHFEGKRLPNATVVSVEADGPSTTADRQLLQDQPQLQPQFRRQEGELLRQAYRLTLDRAVNLPPGSLIASRGRTGDGFKIINCTAEFNRSRGILVKAGQGEIRGNHLEGNWGEAIKLAPEFRWLEAGTSHNVLIENNTIKDCQSVAIGVYSRGATDAFSPVGTHSDIRIINNRIEGGPNPAILVTSTKDLLLKGNMIRSEPGGELLPWVASRLQVDTSPEAVILTNVKLAE